VSEPAIPFSLEQRHEGETVRLLLRAELDLAGAPELSARLKQLAHEGRKVIVDLRALEFIDSSGLSVLIGAAADARRNGWDIAIIRADLATCSVRSRSSASTRWSLPRPAVTRDQGL
jgi:anti-anti-sigma factor